MDYEFPIQELRAQLAQARIADWEQKRFGAASHQYRWNPPASLEEVEQLEQKIGVTLPKEYHDFLIQAGNGGAGKRAHLNAVVPHDFRKAATAFGKRTGSHHFHFAAERRGQTKTGPVGV